jgi:hypothetical protein
MLESGVVEQARAAAARLADAEAELRRVRTDYHAAIRRLHLAGGSVREIADALSLSHQRVQQIVTASGGSWWSRAWRTRNARRDLVCTWCDRPDHDVSKLIAGPDVFICEACVDTAERAMQGATGLAVKRAPERAKYRCSFCSKSSHPTRAVVVGPAANVCEACLIVCRQILDGRAA